MRRLDPARVCEMLRSGDLHRLARQSRNQEEFASRFGVTASSYRRAARKLRAHGVDVPSFEDLRNRTAQNGNAPFEDEPTSPRLDDGTDGSVDVDVSDLDAEQYVWGRSTLRDSAGNVVLQWEKTKTSREQHLQSMLEAMPALVAGRLDGKRAEPIAPPASPGDDDLLSVYVIGDAHLGMYAWSDEAGDNFDLDIAVRDLIGAVDHLASAAPPSAHALLISVGDFVHADNKAGTTTRGTRVDVDTRWPRVMRAGIATLRHMIDRLLARHERVCAFVLPGNHDEHASVALSIGLEQFYAHEPRVDIDSSSDRFRWRRFGECLIGATHGHTAKADRLRDVMTVDRARDWGETRHRVMYTGHVHHDQAKELAGVTIETVRTLATSDAWHWESGYRSGHDMKCDVWHRRWGRIARHIVGLDQLRQRG